MNAWLESGGAVVAVGVAFSAITSLPGLFRARSSLAGEERASHRPGWFASFLSGALFGLSVLPLVGSLELSIPGLILSLWLLLFVCGFLLSMIEAKAFTQGPSPVGLRDVLGALFASAVAAGVAGSLMQGAAAVLRGSDVGTAPMRVPSGRRVILLQLGRGLIAAIVLTPLLASSSASGFDAWARFSMALAATGGVIPLLGAAAWPAYLRAVHAVEIVLFELVYTFALLRILGV